LIQVDMTDQIVVQKLSDVASRLSPVLTGLKKYEANFDAKAKQTIQVLESVIYQIAYRKFVIFPESRSRISHRRGFRRLRSSSARLCFARETGRVLQVIFWLVSKPMHGQVYAVDSTADELLAFRLGI